MKKSALLLIVVLLLISGGCWYLHAGNVAYQQARQLQEQGQYAQAIEKYSSSFYIQTRSF